MLLNIVRQDITKLSGNCVICHCISADAAMGAGVALALTSKYPDLKPTVRSILKTTHSDTLVGHVVFYDGSFELETILESALNKGIEVHVVDIFYNSRTYGKAFQLISKEKGGIYDEQEFNF